MGDRRHNRKLVASKFRAASVPVRTTAHYQTEGTQKIVSGAAAGERYGDKFTLEDCT